MTSQIMRRHDRFSLEMKGFGPQHHPRCILRFILPLVHSSAQGAMDKDVLSCFFGTVSYGYILIADRLTQ